MLESVPLVNRKIVIGIRTGLESAVSGGGVTLAKVVFSNIRF